MEEILGVWFLSRLVWHQCSIDAQTPTQNPPSPHFSEIQGIDQIVFFSAKIDNDEISLEKGEVDEFGNYIREHNEVRRLREGAMKSEQKNQLKMGDFDLAVKSKKKSEKVKNLKFLPDEEDRESEQLDDNDISIESSSENDDSEENEAKIEADFENLGETNAKTNKFTKEKIHEIRSKSSLLKNVEGLLGFGGCQIIFWVEIIGGFAI